MTDVFIILSDAELDQISGGALHMPQPPTPGHNPWHLPQPPISAITLFSNPEFYVRGTTTMKAF
jgi:bacteriocin-like protein